MTALDRREGIKEGSLMRRIPLLLLAALLLLLTACEREAFMASRNLSLAADQFEIERRIVFINGITDNYLLTIEGRCSIKADAEDSQLEVTCKDGPTSYKKHFLGLSDNVSYLVEQLEPARASVYHYRVIFRPSVILPDIDLELP